jgi:hypothetical protein
MDTSASSDKSSTSNMSVSEPNLTASEMSAVSLLETFAAVARRRAGAGSGGGVGHPSTGSSVSSTNSINISRSQVIFGPEAYPFYQTFVLH